MTNQIVGVLTMTYPSNSTNERAEAIKTALRACKTPREIENVSTLYREEVQALHENKATRVHAIQIVNLKAYMLNDF